ncbi:RNA-binding domain-containing protein, partial [Suhomyces tanzawaensis NRRL Y-17324]
KDSTEKPADKSVDQIEQDLQLPNSSDELDESEENLSDESSDELEGLSDNENDEETRTTTKEGHIVNKKISKQVGKALSTSEQRGVIYIGRIPHGFYENEMKRYFNQFGNIINLRISRNKKTGKSKHYGFLEFENLATAKIAAETMNNYLLFGHLLKCEVVENFHEDLFKNANRRFTPAAGHKISKEKNDKPKTKEQWEELIKKHENKKSSKQAELKDKGINFDLNSI